MNYSPGTWRTKVFSALILLIAIAIGARIIWELIAPLLPGLVALTIVIFVVWAFVRPR
jgi:hypothetical protein